MESKSFRSETYWIKQKQIKMNLSLRAEESWDNSQASFKTFPRLNSDTSISLSKALWTLWRPQDPIFIMSGNSCLNRSSRVSPKTPQFTLGPSIDICNSCFSDKFVKDADKAEWRFVAFGRFRNFDTNFLVRTCLSLLSQYLSCRSIYSFCRILSMLSSYDITKYGEAFINFSRTSLSFKK